ncbi:uncharacterized protein [Lepidochelys kempii]|uniref:uncharacterized protein isoform X2 n=1 Tax=Lepidochelys kempii TaxID=8472 RepID=UPI003C6ED78C
MELLRAAEAEEPKDLGDAQRPWRLQDYCTRDRSSLAHSAVMLSIKPSLRILQIKKYSQKYHGTEGQHPAITRELCNLYDNSINKTEGLGKSRVQ